VDLCTFGEPVATAWTNFVHYFAQRENLIPYTVMPHGQ